MGWKDSEVTQNLVILGDKQGNHLRVGGLLHAIKPDNRYHDRNNYEIVQKDGSVITLAGSAGLDMRIHESHIGLLGKFEYLGKLPGSNAKAVKVTFFENEGTPEDKAFHERMLKEWPGYAEATAQRAGGGKSGERTTSAPAGDDDGFGTVAATAHAGAPNDEELPF